MSLDRLLEQLSDRGFSTWMSVRVASFGTRKIMVIKEVRTLTSWGLARTKDAVERGEVLFEALTPARAREVAAQLEGAGAVVAVELVRAHRLGFSPRDPQRGAQVCERLSVIGDELLLERGQLGAWERAEGLAAGDDAVGDRLLSAIDQQRARWAGAGLREASDELELISELSARELQLEAQVVAADGEQLRREAAVYGDWLQGQGDPRGLIAALALALDEDGLSEPERARRAHALAQAQREHASHLLGPVVDAQDHARLRWCGPMLAGLELSSEPSGPDGPHDRLTELEQLLALPISAALRDLLLQGRAAEHPTLGSLLAGAACAPSLRTLDIRDARRFACVGRFERLERLALGVVELDLRALAAPKLRDLRIDLMFPPDDLAAVFDGLDAPLRQFAFMTEIHDYWDQHHGPLHVHLRRLFAQPSFAKLRGLTLASRDRSQAQPPGLCEVLLSAPAIATLERIDLRGLSLTRAAQAELLEQRERLPGLELREQPSK